MYLAAEAFQADDLNSFPAAAARNFHSGSAGSHLSTISTETVIYNTGDQVSLNSACNALFNDSTI